MRSIHCDRCDKRADPEVAGETACNTSGWTHIETRTHVESGDPLTSDPDMGIGASIHRRPGAYGQEYNAPPPVRHVRLDLCKECGRIVLDAMNRAMLRAELKEA